MRSTSSVLFAVGATVLTLAVIIAGFLVIGSPREARLQRLDGIRAKDLAALSNAIANYRRTHEELPATLADLGPATLGYMVLIHHTDPSGHPYRYVVKGPFSYELCAKFDTATVQENGNRGIHSIFYIHGRGWHCFAQEARPPTRR